MNKFERFCYKNEHRGIRNLMLLIAVCNVSVYFLSWLFTDFPVISWLILDPALVMSGQVWRLFTFIFIPASNNIFMLVLVCYYYYWIGGALENEWGTLKFNIFYFTGIAGTVIFSMFTGSYGTALYLNMSLFFAFATLFPEHRILLFFVIPIKVKYLAVVEAVWFLYSMSVSMPQFPQNLIPLIALLNYFLFFYQYVIRFFKNRRGYGKKRADFKSAVRQSRSRPGYEGYVHKCALCGMTDTQNPDAEFRYCSLCAHYECYCSQHIFTHDHIKEE